MAGLAGQSLIAGGFDAAFAAFAVAAVVIVLLLFAASLMVGVAQEGVVARARAGGQTVKRWGGIVLVVVGVWFIVLAVWAQSFESLFPV